MRTIEGVTALLFALFACNTPKSMAPQRPGSAVLTPPTLTFASPASRYNAPSEPAPSTPLGDMVLEYVRAAATSAGRKAPIADDRLFLASHALATVMPEDGAVSYPFVEFALQSNGVLEPSPHILVLWGQLNGPRGPLAQAFRPELDAIFRSSDVARVGVGAVVRDRNGYGALVLTLVISRIWTSPIARSLPVDTSVDFDFIVPVGWTPEAEMMQPDGTVNQITLRRKDDGGFVAAIDCAGAAGKRNISIEANTGTDVETLAKFPLWCGEEPPRTFTITPPAEKLPADPLDAEREIYALVNAERKRAGRLPLRWDHGLAASARDHSRAMSAAKVVAHTLPGNQSLKQRVGMTRRDILIATTIARAYGIVETHRGFFELPSTRRDLISEDATEIGIGIEYGPVVYPGIREMYVTEIIARPRR
jgi:uncharacterized protein YkwD